MDKNKVSDLCKLAKKFSALYRDEEAGLCGVGVDYNGASVQVTEEAFASLMGDYSGWSVKKRNTEEYPYIAEMKINGVMFFAVGTDSDFAKAGISVPDQSDD